MIAPDHVPHVSWHDEFGSGQIGTTSTPTDVAVDIDDLAGLQNEKPYAEGFSLMSAAEASADLNASQIFRADHQNNIFDPCPDPSVRTLMPFLPFLIAWPMSQGMSPSDQSNEMTDLPDWVVCCGGCLIGRV